MSGATGFGAMALLALTGTFLATTGGPASARSAGTAALDASGKTTPSVSHPSPKEGHSPQVTHALSGPLSGTGAARKGSTTRMSPAVQQATAAAASTMLNGIDVSSFQHPNNSASDINWTSVASGGYRFAAIKATEGNYYTNPYYASDAANAAAAGMYVSAYAFANPYDPSSNGTATQQADYAVTNAGNYTVGGQRLPMMLDLEPDPYATQDHVNQCYGLSTSAMVTWISDFMTEAAAKTGARPIIYTTTNWWNTCTGHSTAFGSDVLWVAAYAAGTPGTLPDGWNTWNMWQYTSAGTVSGISGSNGNTDLDYFSGAPETVHTTVNTAAQSVQLRTLSALAGQQVTYTAAGLPPGTSISSSGLITGTPTTIGSYNVNVTPSGSAAVVPASVSFTWTVSGTITMTSPGNQTVTAGSPVYLRVAAADSASGYTPSFTAAGLPPGLAINSSGRITGWPDTPGTYTTTVTATDSLGAKSSATFTWTISQAANSGPAGRAVLANGGKCLDDPGSNTANGTRLDIWTCTGGANQKWTVVQDGTLRVSGKCLDVANGGTANGTAVQLSTCTAGAASQRWRPGANAELVNPHSGKCLDDPAFKTANGTKLDIYPCNGGNNQRWTLPAGPAVSGIAGKCLDDNAYSTANGNKIDVYTCNGGGSQKWTVMPDGTLRVAGRCLDDPGSNTASGTKIDIWTCNGGAGQKWKVTPTGDLAAEVVNPNSGKCLADPADSTANGTQMEILPCSAADPGMSWRVG